MRVVTKRTCPKCGGRKDYYAKACQRCATWAKPLLGVTGPRHPAWKGEGIIDRDGYLRTYAPTHPWPRRGGYIPEHVRVMELSIGRRITADECVHHVDHDRTNNQLGNLALLGKGEHSRYHRLANPRRRDPLTGRFVGGAANA